jgi:outer membrane autotransporter protein
MYLRISVAAVTVVFEAGSAEKSFCRHPHSSEALLMPSRARTRRGIKLTMQSLIRFGLFPLLSCTALTLPAAAQQIRPVPGTTALQTLGGQNAAQSGMARSIDAVCPTLVANQQQLVGSQKDLQVVCTRMVQTARGNPELGYDITTGQTNNALQAINGEEMQLPKLQTQQAVAGQSNIVNARLAALRAGSVGPISVVGFDRFGEYDVASTEETAAPESSLLAGDRFGVFLTGNFGWGDRDSSSQITGFDFEGPALSFGADYRVTDQIVVGAAFGYARFEADFDDNANSPSGQKFESDTYTFSLYGSYYPTDHIYIDALASIGTGDYEGRRHIVILSNNPSAPAEDRRAKSNFNGTVWGGTVNTGYDYAFANGLTLTPNVGLDYQGGSFDSYQESGASGLNLEYGSMDVHSFTGRIGVQVSYPVSLSFGVLQPYARADFVHAFVNDDDGLSVAYASDPTGLSQFEADTASTDDNYGLLAAGVSMVLPRSFSLFAEYDTVIGLSDYTVNRVVAGLRKSF